MFDLLRNCHARCGGSKMKRVTKPPTEDVAWRQGSSPPAGFILWHNNVKHDARTRQGTNGFRAWYSLPSAKHVVCDCGWRPELGKHYRIDREALSASVCARS